MSGPRRGLSAVLLACALVTGCAPATPTGDEQRLQVAAAFYPLAWAATQVGGDRVEVTNLTSPGGEPHDLELGFRESVLVARADLVVLEHGFQPAVDDTVASVAEGPVLDVTDVISLRPFPTETTAGPDASGADPHFWLDPMLMADLGDALAGSLADLDPEHGQEYAARAARLRRSLTALDTAFRDGLTGCARDTVVVSHDAFGYLERYGLRMEAINGISPDAEPTPAALARLQQLVRDTGITTVFSEQLASPKLAETLAGDLGIDTAVLDPVEGLSDQTATDTYLTLMRANLAALKEANGC